eukprot:CAMPEP_0115345148 /NCGR_PEP_ID=MMETSP0270-20121206/93667_1 /TAXON_ID=71861 /ORGANISM="Scrippsiella trochoidea, Strain CCMP3099" /LENGTH=126 /DNA_ID=CAMNT_0002766933 /DNA_START=239 /DNA_END=615 /DNA_ORIENTATION=+
MFDKNQIRNEEARKEADDLVCTLELKTQEIHDMLPLDSEGEAKKEDVMSIAMPAVAELFDSALVEYTEFNLVQLVDLMDTDSSGKVSAGEFQRAIMTYAAGVKPLSIQEVHYNTYVCLQRMEALQG